MVVRMARTGRSSRRPVPTKSSLPPPPWGRALAFGGAAALLGALLWGGMRYQLHLEIGWLAWGIGVLVGLAIVKGRGYGTGLAAAAAVLTVLALAGGKYLAWHYDVRGGVSAVLDQYGETEHADRLALADAWAALGARPTKEQVSAFLLDHDLGDEDPVEYASVTGPELTAFAKERPSLAAAREQLQAQIGDLVAAEVPFTTWLRQDLRSGKFLIFVVLGLASAFSLVERATAKLRALARERHRRERADAASGEGAGVGRAGGDAERSA